MLKRVVLFAPIACVAAECGPTEIKDLPSEYRIDAAGDRDLIDSHSTQMCVAPNGTVYVVWIDDRDGGDDIWFNRKLAEGDRNDGWLPNAVRVNTHTDSNVWAPQIACTNQQVHVVWEDDRDGEVESHQIYYQRTSDNGETFLESDLLIEEDEDGRSNSFAPQIIAKDATVYVAWYDDLNGAYDILTATSSDSGNSWQEPVRVDTDQPAGSAWSAHPRIAASEDGQNLYVVWQDFRGGVGQPNAGSDIYYSMSSNRGIEFLPEDIRLDGGDPGSASAFAPRVAADGTDVYVVWHDNRAGEANDVFMVYSSDGGASFSSDSRADQAAPLGTESLYPKLCVTNGRAHVVWHDARDGQFRVYYNQANAGLWAGQEFRLDAEKVPGERGVWRLDGGAGSVQLACEGDNVLASWLDIRDDVSDLGYNDLAYNFSADNGATWLIGADESTQVGWNDAPYRLDSIQAGTAYKTDLNVHIEGTTVRAAWTDGRSGSTDVYYQQLTAGETPVVLLGASDFEE